jgi:Mn2+/Fe2+ NRAMP family transporter
MSQLLGGSQVLLGLGLIVGWWLMLKLVGRTNHGKPMTAIGFVGTTSIFLLWFVGAAILILRGFNGV